jgi:hypothetical protein
VTLPDDLLGRVRYYAVEIAATVGFLAWVGRSLWHELGFDRKKRSSTPRKPILRPTRSDLDQPARGLKP